MLLVKGASSQRRRQGVNASQQLGIQNNRISMHRISGAQNKLSLLSSQSDKAENHVVHSVSLPFSDGESCPVQTVLTDAGFNGVSDFGSTFGTSHNERLSALDHTSMSVFPATSQSTNENNSYVCQSAQTLEKPRDSQNGDSLGGGVVESYYDDGRVIKGLGSNSDGQSGKRCVASTADSQAYKLLGVAGSVSSTETFSELHQGPTCFSENRQFYCGCVYQPAGRHTLSSAASVSEKADRVVQHKAFIHQSDRCSTDIEQGSRFIVQRKSSVRGVDASSPGSEADMAEVRSGCRRSLRLRKTLNVLCISL